MDGIRWLNHPRPLAAWALLCALVPAMLAVVTYRDAKEKDARLFQTSAEVLAEQLGRALEPENYFLGLVRGQTRDLDEAALTSGRMVPAFDWREKLPHLLAIGYAEQTESRIVLRWKSAERLPLDPIGADLALLPGVPEALKKMSGRDYPAVHSSRIDRDRLIVLLPVPQLPSRPARGFVVGWLNLESLCRDEQLPLLRDGVLTAVPMAAGDPVLPGVVSRLVRQTGAKELAAWPVAVRRGPHFSREYGAPAPWLAFLAAGLSAVPLLILTILAGRAERWRTALVAEREVLRQQRYFTQSVSHEFRTPLGIILSGTDLLDRYAAHLTPERRGEVLGEMRDNTRHLSGMVERILFLGRMESGKLTCTPLRTSLAAFSHEVVRKVTAATPGSNISVSAPDKEVLLDAPLLGSVLDNLLNNAVKYSAAGQPVTLTVELDERSVIFTVRDEGIGIPPEDLPQVCVPFHRCANVGDVPGTGLGLAIAQRGAALHGGTLKLASPGGRGTVATVTIPLL